jgi:hypothetical protein
MFKLLTGVGAAKNATPRTNEKREKPKILKVIDVTSK